MYEYCSEIEKKNSLTKDKEKYFKELKLREDEENNHKLLRKRGPELERYFFSLEHPQ